MRVPVLDVSLDVLSEGEVLHALLEAPGDHVAFLGAGVSKEAGVPLAGEIAEEIRRKLVNRLGVHDPDQWANRYLSWADPSARYAAAVQRYGSAADRVAFFRQMLQEIQPSFAHHAVALLMAHRRLFATALTTNFDKLLERAFTEQGFVECQAIRTASEAEFWGQEQNKCYVLKLHGDYDTHNILNTRPETRTIPDFFASAAADLFRGRGLVVLGSAGNEQSMVDFLRKLLDSADPRILARGVRWGVYVGAAKPTEMSVDDSAARVVQAIEDGRVNQRIVQLLAEANDRFLDQRPCSVFPIWGSGEMLFRLIGEYADAELSRTAQLFLDHEMRLRSIFEAGGLSPDAVVAHLDRLATAQRSVNSAQPRRTAAAPTIQASAAADPTEISLRYGDIAALAGAPAVAARAAIVSPEDTTVSAGGGVAYSLMTKAGPRTMLNELAKHTPIAHGAAVVTSAGNLPLHYIIHAAALHIQAPDGTYLVDAGSVRSAAGDALRQADALGVEVIWLPLLGAGTGLLPVADSVAATLEAVLTTPTTLARRSIRIVVLDETVLAREHAESLLRAALPASFTITRTYDA